MTQLFVKSGRNLFQESVVATELKNSKAKSLIAMNKYNYDTTSDTKTPYNVVLDR